MLLRATSKGFSILFFCRRPTIQDTLRQNVGGSATAVDERNPFNSASRQKILDGVYATFSQLATFVETWYLICSPLWFNRQDHTAELFSAMKESNKVICFFTNLGGPILWNTFWRMHNLCLVNKFYGEFFCDLFLSLDKKFSNEFFCDMFASLGKKISSEFS